MTPESTATHTLFASTILRHARRRRRIQIELLNALAAHQVLLDLAGHCHREGINELDVARDLEVRNLAATSD
jgi:hypothetical protein